MFKKLVYKIAAIKTEGDRNECFAEIDKAFDNDKITWNDHETLYSLAAAVVTAENQTEVLTVKNNVLVEMLEAEGFTAFEDENDPAQRMQEFCNSAGQQDGLVLLRRDFKFATGDATHASVLVDTVRGRAYFAWWQNARYPIKNRWYETAGRRTHNAIIDTIRIAGHKI